MRPLTMARVLLGGLLSLGVVVSCDKGGAPQIAVGMDGCASCGMTIPEANQACAFTVDKEEHLFCSPGCLLKEHEARRRAKRPAPDSFFFADHESAVSVPGETAVFLLTERIPTVMDWGILAFSDRAQALGLAEEDDQVIDWLGLRTLRGDVDRSIEVTVTPEGLEPEVVELQKGELVEWVVGGRNLNGDLSLALRGYEELGEIAVAASGEPVSRRMLAVRPGDGFPFIRTDSGTVIGQVRIRGAHTADEAAE